MPIKYYSEIKIKKLYLNFFLYTFAKAFLIEGLTLLLKAKDARILCVYETCSTE